jgi:hypothetical protein
MQTRYYKITGLNEGLPIEPFAVTADELDSALQESGDMCRYYEPITQEEYERLNSPDQFYVKSFDPLGPIEGYYVINQNNEQVSGVMSYDEAHKLAREWSKKAR